MHVKSVKQQKQQNPEATSPSIMTMLHEKQHLFTGAVLELCFAS